METKCILLLLRTLVVDPSCHGRRELKHLSTYRKIYLRYSVSSNEWNQILAVAFDVNNNCFEQQVDKGVNPGLFDIKIMVSSTRHDESRPKIGGPPSKPKHICTTDSELVPWGKGETDVRTGQWNRSWNRMLTSSRRVQRPDDVPFA